MIGCITRIFQSVNHNPIISTVILTSGQGALQVVDGSVQFTSNTGLLGDAGTYVPISM